MTSQIQPHFVSYETFLKSYSTLYYGTDRDYLAVMTPDEKVCALALKSFPNAGRLLMRYQKQTLVEKSISLQENIFCLLPGTPFQHQVWKTLLEIPRGITISYQELAHRLQRPRAVRAVGSAVGANPISPLIPCHRVIGSNGQIGGYFWGVPAKLALLQEEGVDISSF